MNVLSKTLAIGLCLFLMTLIIELVRRRKLKEKYALLWIFLGLIIFVLAIFENILFWFTSIAGIKVPLNGVFLFGIFFMILINIHFSIIISKLVEQNKKIAQKLALLETKFNQNNK